MTVTQLENWLLETLLYRKNIFTWREMGDRQPFQKDYTKMREGRKEGQSL